MKNDCFIKNICSYCKNLEQCNKDNIENTRDEYYAVEIWRCNNYKKNGGDNYEPDTIRIL